MLAAKNGDMQAAKDGEMQAAKPVTKVVHFFITFLMSGLI